MYDGLSFAQKMLEEVEEQIALEKWVSNVEQEAKELLALIEKIDTLSPAEENRLTELLNKNEENLKAVSSAEMPLAKEESSLQATQINLPRKNPSFEGLSSDQFAEIAEDTLEKTETFAENIRFGDEYKVYEEFRNNYTRIYQNGLSVVNQMVQEVKSLLEKGSTLSPG